MNVFKRLLGTVSAFFQIGGPQGPGWNDNAGAIEAKDATNTVFANARGADPLVAQDFVTLNALNARAPSVLVYREGAVGLLPWNVVGSWTDLIALFAKTAGPVVIAIDTSISPTNLPVATFDFESRTTFVPYITASPSFTQINLDIPDGASLMNVSGFIGCGRARQIGGGAVFFVNGNGTAVSPLSFDGSPSGSALVLDDYVTVINNGTVPMIAVANGGLVYAKLTGGAFVGPGFMDVVLGGQGIVEAFSHSTVFADAFSGAGTINFNYDETVALTSQASATAFTPLLLNAGIPKGQTTLAGGVSPVITCPNLKSTSTIVAFLRTPTGSITATTQYAALATDRVFGIAGSFKISALSSGPPPVLNAADDSDLDWSVEL